MDSSAHGADEGEGWWVREILWLGGEFEVDDTIDSDLGYGRVSWCSGGGCTAFNEDYVYACPSSFVSLLEESICVEVRMMR